AASCPCRRQQCQLAISPPQRATSRHTKACGMSVTLTGTDRAVAAIPPTEQAITAIEEATTAIERAIRAMHETVTATALGQAPRAPRKGASRRKAHQHSS